MDTAILEGLGLSKGEIKVYLALIEFGETKAGIVIEKAGMASSAVHNSINSLIGKGLVSFAKKGKIKHYRAVPPRQLMDFIEEKKKKLAEILPELESRQMLAKEKQEAEVFEGIKGVTAMLNMLIEDARKGDDYLFFAIDVEENEEVQKFFRMYDAKRKEKGLVVKGLAPKELKPLFAKRKVLKMKYPSFPIPSNISVCNDKTTLFSWGKKPVGYLIKSRQIADMYKDFFNRLWKN